MEYIRLALRKMGGFLLNLLPNNFYPANKALQNPTKNQDAPKKTINTDNPHLLKLIKEVAQNNIDGFEPQIDLGKEFLSTINSIANDSANLSYSKKRKFFEKIQNDLDQLLNDRLDKIADFVRYFYDKEHNPRFIPSDDLKKLRYFFVFVEGYFTELNKPENATYKALDPFRGFDSLISEKTPAVLKASSNGVNNTNRSTIFELFTDDLNKFIKSFFDYNKKTIFDRNDPNYIKIPGLELESLNINPVNLKPNDIGFGVIKSLVEEVKILKQCQESIKNVSYKSQEKERQKNAEAKLIIEASREAEAREAKAKKKEEQKTRNKKQPSNNPKNKASNPTTEKNNSKEEEEEARFLQPSYLNVDFNEEGFVKVTRKTKKYIIAATHQMPPMPSNTTPNTQDYKKEESTTPIVNSATTSLPLLSNSKPLPPQTEVHNQEALNPIINRAVSPPPSNQLPSNPKSSKPQTAPHTVGAYNVKKESQSHMKVGDITHLGETGSFIGAKIEGCVYQIYIDPVERRSVIFTSQDGSYRTVFINPRNPNSVLVDMSPIKRDLGATVYYH